MSKLKKQYDLVCNEYIKKFVRKQGIAFDYWVGDEVGVIASFIEQYFFNLSEIIYDIESRQPKGLILEWQDETVENSMKNNTHKINYYSYSLGLRCEDVMKMEPEGLKQSPPKPVDVKLEKVKEGWTPPINTSINFLDSIRLILQKKLENTAFESLQQSKGVTVVGASVGGGFLANINWVQLFTGDITEIIKLVVSILGFAVSFLTKK